MNQPVIVSEQKRELSYHASAECDPQHIPYMHACMQEPDQRYGCGYRNLQTMMSYLAHQGPEYIRRLYGGRGVPTVRALQRSMELSWQNGFDTDGASQLVRAISVCASKAARS